MIVGDLEAPKVFAGIIKVTRCDPRAGRTSDFVSGLFSTTVSQSSAMPMAR
jgi:hypothetical protein